jgi:hypothetical protein
LFIVAIVDIFRQNLKKHQQLFDLAAPAGRPAMFYVPLPVMRRPAYQLNTT